jgi:regulator of replication initiation timing
MNRTILIVICDFLLISLLAFSAVEVREAPDNAASTRLTANAATNQVDDREDLAAVMRLALEEERKQRDLLMGELETTRETAEQRQEMLSEREQQVRTFQQRLETKEEETRRLQAQQAEIQRQYAAAQSNIENLSQKLDTKDVEARRLQQQRAEIQQQFAAAQSNIEDLSQELKSSTTETLITREQLAAMETDLRERARQAEALKQQLDQLSQSNQLAQAEKQQLANRLQVAEVEKQHAARQVVVMREQVQAEREEKAKLAEGVNNLASQSGELAQEIRENRPLAPNTIFNEFVANRVQAQFTGTRAGFLGRDANKSTETRTVLVSDGTNTYALCHVDDTPLTLWDPGTDWQRLTGTLAGKTARTKPIESLSFHLTDPRVVFMPVSAEEANTLGSKIYSLASDPFRFQEAVLVGAREGYYGECRFEIDLATPNYVKLDRSLLKGMFGKFNPSRGDLVFSKTGELIGIMANSEYCLTIQNFESSATLQLGEDTRRQQTGSTLSQLYSSLQQKPLRLQ